MKVAYTCNLTFCKLSTVKDLLFCVYSAPIMTYCFNIHLFSLVCVRKNNIEAYGRLFNVDNLFALVLFVDCCFIECVRINNITRVPISQSQNIFVRNFSSSFLLCDYLFIGPNGPYLQKLGQYPVSVNMLTI